MKSKFPIKNLNVLNWVLSFSIVFFVFAFIIILKKDSGDFQKAIVYSVVTFLALLISGYINIGTLLYLEKRIAHNSLKFSIIRYISSFLLNGFVYNIIFVFCFTYLDEWHFNPLVIMYSTILSIFISILIIVLQNYIILIDAKIHGDLENSHLKTAHAEATNQLLRQQIQPHFLFNALNTLKSLYKKNPKAAEEYLVYLSDFLRASVSNSNIKITRLKEEIKLCFDYLGMQKIRFGDALTYSISISDEKLENGFVPSFSIQPLLENAIKHNELTEESPLCVTIKQEGERVKITNNLQVKTTSEISTGSGLANLSERYRILSNDELIIEDEGISFSVSIKILDHENNNNRG